MDGLRRLVEAAGEEISGGAEEGKGPATPRAFVWRNTEAGGERTARMKRMVANRAEVERREFAAAFSAQQLRSWDLQTELFVFLSPEVKEQRIREVSQKLAELQG